MPLLSFQISKEDYEYHGKAPVLLSTQNARKFVTCFLVDSILVVVDDDADADENGNLRGFVVDEEEEEEDDRAVHPSTLDARFALVATTVECEGAGGNEEGYLPAHKQPGGILK